MGIVRVSQIICLKNKRQRNRRWATQGATRQPKSLLSRAYLAIASRPRSPAKQCPFLPRFFSFLVFFFHFRCFFLCSLIFVSLFLSHAVSLFSLLFMLSPWQKPALMELGKQQEAIGLPPSFDQILLPTFPLVPQILARNFPFLRTKSSVVCSSSFVP